MNIAGEIRVIKRDGNVVAFDGNKIVAAITKAFIAVEGSAYVTASSIRDQIQDLAQAVTERIARGNPDGGTVDIEDIQDQVELALMRGEFHRIARAYVIYREQRAAERRERERQEFQLSDTTISFVRADGTRAPLEQAVWSNVLDEICGGLSDVEPSRLFDEMASDAHNDITEQEVFALLIMTARSLIEEEPQYSTVAARILFINLRKETLEFLMPDQLQVGASVAEPDMDDVYQSVFPAFIQRGIDLGFLNPELGQFDLDALAKGLKPERDRKFAYLGLRTLYDRYFLHSEGTRFELPQVFFMRVAMGLALGETYREERAIEFYETLSSFNFMSSTPTLFNSGTVRSQLSSCYISTVPDDLEGIYNSIHDNAMLSKWAGGLGNDWTRVRALGAYIRGTNGKSQGVVPFLKVVNDTAVAVNQGGKRRGAVCSYLESWHLDIEEFLELRKNTGDDRRRTPDMHTANWIPDLFMERVHQRESWTLFSPHDVPELHELYGNEFRVAYENAEARARAGTIKQFKVVDAVELWRKMLTALFETGHAWITFKDPINLRSPQQHAGVIHSSNLCTEITLNTSDDEIAVCNLGSINLSNHMSELGELDYDKLRTTVRTAVRMLDNVIDINYYAVTTARNSNARHRPIGLGLMGFHDALFKKRVPYSSPAAVQFADNSMEAISYFAIEASSDLAQERGTYHTYEGSLWQQGILPLDSLKKLQEERNNPEYCAFDTTATMDWDTLRDKVVQHGMRNSNVMAIAPTATIANITGVTQSIEPTLLNLFVKANLSGDFTVANTYLIDDLKRLDMWDRVMSVELKANNGSVQRIEQIPEDLRELYVTAFEIDQQWLIECASRRQKWIDQSQSLNLYCAKPSGPTLDAMYRNAWRLGLKTTYYLRTLSASDAEKSTLDDDQSLMSVKAARPQAATPANPSGTGVKPTLEPSKVQAAAQERSNLSDPQAPYCSFDDPDCEACQ